MATTVRQDRDFMEEIFGTEKLQEALDWIADHMSPDEVFSRKQLEAWADDNGYVEGGEK